MSLGCGSCNACCTLLHVPDIGKPAGMKCWWTGLHGGCARHAEKDTAPELGACASYKCLWLESQENSDPDKRHPRHMRPDQTGVVMGVPDPSGENDDILHIHVNPKSPDAWHQPNVAYYLNDFITRGATLNIHIGKDVSFAVTEAF